MIIQLIFHFFFKMVNPLKLKNEILPLAPLAPFIYLTKLKSKKKKEIKNIQYRVQKVDQTNFIKKLNQNYKNLIGSNIYDEKYWQWFRINRPKRYKGIIVTAYKNEKLIGGGTILKSYFLVLKYILSHYVISDLFVDPELRKNGIGRSILNRLESYAARESSFILAFIHKYNFDMKLLLKQSGYFSTPNAEMEMIKPISKDFIQIYELQKRLKKPWIAPLEQSGF